MSDDLHPPPEPFPAPDEEELEAANALRQALEGRPAGSRVPEEALQAAAFLRHAGDGGRLSSERRARLRAELLSSLPAAPTPARRKGWRDWLGIGITLTGAASAAITVGVLSMREWSGQDRASAARSAASESVPVVKSKAEAETERDSAETATYGDAARAAPRGAAAPAPPAESGAGTDDTPRFAQPALGGLHQAPPGAPTAASSERRRVTALESSGAAAPEDGAEQSVARAASKRRAPSAGAPLNQAAPELDARQAQGPGSLGAAEAKGGAAGAAIAATASANPAGPAKELYDTDARIARQRQDQRSRLLARLTYTPAPGAYREADRASSTAELQRAREQLAALSGTGLGGASSALEAEQLRPDIHCRLAELSLRLGQPRAALDWVRQGLALGSAPTPFVACLYQQQGRAREALGDRSGAGQSYMNALQVNEQLLNESLEGP